MRACPVSSPSKIAGAAPLSLAVFLSIGPQLAAAAEANDGSVLPFPPTPSASVAAPTLQELHDGAAGGTKPPVQGRA